MALSNITYLQTTVATIGATGDNLFASQNIGTASSDRWVLCCFHTIGDNQPFLSADIGGVTATLMYNPTTNPSSPIYFMANVPTGTTADVHIHLNGSQAGSGILSTYMFTGSPDTTKVDGAFFVGARNSNPGLSVVAKNGGLVVAGFVNTKRAGVPEFTWGTDSPAMTNDASSVAVGNNYVSTRHIQPSADGTETMGGFTPTGTDVIRISMLSIKELVTTATSTIDQTLSGFTQTVTVKEVYTSSIAQTLSGFTQDFEGDVPQPSATISQTLPGFTQSLNAVTDVAPIDFETVLFPMSQALLAAVVVPTRIDQTLPKFTQAASGHSTMFTASIDMTLFGSPRPPLSNLTYRGMQTFGAPGPFIDFSFPAGTPSSDRWVLGWLWTANGLHQPINPTINGFPATVIFNPATGLPHTPFVFMANVPTGTTAAIEVNTQVHQDTSFAMVCYTWNGTPDFTLMDSQTYLGTASGYHGSALATKNGGFVLNGLASGIQASLPATEDALTPTMTTDVPGTAIFGNVRLTHRSRSVSETGGTQTIGATHGSQTIRIDTISVQPLIGGAATTLSQELDALVITPILSTIGQTLVGFGQATQQLNVKVSPAAQITTVLQHITQLLSPVTVFPPNTEVATIATVLPVFTQELDALTDTVAVINQTLSGFVQEFDANAVNFPTTDILTSLPLFTQEIDVDASPAAQIFMTLPRMEQEADVEVDNPPDTVVAAVDQTLPGFTQALSASVEIPVVVETLLDFNLFGLQQELDVTEEMVTFIDTTLYPLGQEIDVGMEAFAVIDQTLRGFTQEADVSVEMVAAIDQTLPGFTQVLAAAIEIDSRIDQTLLGFEQEADATVEEVSIIDQTLRGLMQEIDVEVDNPAVPVSCTIDFELPGFSQQIIVHVPTSKDLRDLKRPGHAIPMPSKDMPIHPGELELFRRKVYARNVDAMVPPNPIAARNLTTSRHPTSRPVVNRTPLGKPKS